MLKVSDWKLLVEFIYRIRRKQLAFVGVVDFMLHLFFDSKMTNSTKGRTLSEPARLARLARFRFTELAGLMHALFPLKIVVVVFIGEGGLPRLAEIPVAQAEISVRGPACLPI